MGFIGKQPAKAAITSSDITDGIVTADKLASDSVTTAKIADTAVTTAKITDANITTAKIAGDAVTDAKIADDVVGTEHLTAGEVDTTALGADAVTAAKIADNAISEEHLDATIITGLSALAATPADTDEFLISDAGTLKKIDYSYIKGGGITMAQQWRVTSSATGDHTPIDSNWEKADSDGAGYIGSDMSESSGIFTFPSTGIYYINFQVSISTTATLYNNIIIQTTTNNSSYGSAAEGYVFLYQNSEYSTSSVDFIFDVTDTSTHKVRFASDPQDNNTRMMGDSGNHRTGVTFIRLGDT